MGQRIVFPLPAEKVILWAKKQEPKAVVEENVTKIAKNKISGARLPVVFTALELADGVEVKSFKDILALEPEDVLYFGSAGFKYRRTSHHASIEWWGGRPSYDEYNDMPDGPTLELLALVAKALVYQSVLEGRKRVECFDHWQEYFSPALELAGFVHEGVHKDYKEMNPEWHEGRTGYADVDVWAVVHHEDGLPEVPEDVLMFLVESEVVKEYWEKNQKLFEKDGDLYREVKDKRFIDIIIDAHDTVLTHPSVCILTEFDGKMFKEDVNDEFES